MAHDYSENILVQESAGQLLRDELGWEVVYAYDKEVLGSSGTLGRHTYRDVLLMQRLREALHRLNTWITDRQVDEVIAKLAVYSATASLLQINEQKYRMLTEGVEVEERMPDGSSRARKVRLIDFEKPEANDFLAVREMKIHGQLYRRRTDIVGFVNGIPLLFVELKAANVAVEDAYYLNYLDYLDTIPQLFHYNAFLMLSNGYEAKVGTLGSKYEFFHEWKRLSEADAGSVELATMLRGICNKRNFIDLVENFILFDHSDGNTAKILSRNHQFLGVNQAVEAYRSRKLRDGKLGVFWHTQGSGKSYSMLFFTKKILRKFEGSPTFVVLTDREELNTQIAELYAGCGLYSPNKGLSGRPDRADDEGLGDGIASSGANLIRRLQNNATYIFSLIHKFNNPDATPIIPDHEIILISDEAHRTQNGVYAENMMRLLPTAHRIGFTGTPLLTNDNITKRTFGDYISVYDFKRAVDDNATVPLFYENRGEKLKELENPEINAQIMEAIEQSDLDPSQWEKAEREFAKEIHVLTSEKRLRMIAKDFARHYSDLWTSGKAMFVCLNKVTCVRMYDYVQEYWRQIIAELEEQIKHNKNQQEVQELGRKLRWMRSTEMAVVVSQEQNEVATFAKWGLDIKTHREKMERRELDKEYKKRDNPLRVVFVCAMWLTGFDVKPLACLYIDKPLKAHTLMQTIARANRVDEGKPNGLIIDYIGIVRALRRALADYTCGGDDGGSGSEGPAVDKEELLRQLYEAVGLAKALLHEHGFELEGLIRAKGFDKMMLLRDAADAMCGSVELRKTYCGYASRIARIMKFVCSGEIADSQLLAEKDAVTAVYGQLQAKRKHADITDLSVAINRIVSEHVGTEPEADLSGTRRFDISRIDFDMLQKEFDATKHKRLLIEDLEEVIKKRIQQMLAANPSRIDFYEQYRQIISDYNAEQNRASIEKTFQALIHLSQSMTLEEKRYVREGFGSDEELAMFDLLCDPNISKSEIENLKKFSVELLKKVKEKIAELHNWREKPATCAEVETLIRDILWEGLPDSCVERDDLFTSYRERVYEYFFERYPVVA